MNTYQDFSKDEFVENKIEVTCIGAFDGLHRGHIELIKKTKKVDNNNGGSEISNSASASRTK